VDLDRSGSAARLCVLLAGDRGQIVSLAALALRNPYRGLSGAEVDALRGALPGETGTIGYVCRGAVPAGGDRAGASAGPDWSSSASGRLIVATDHVNLTWRSPLMGPNDDSVGPRFPAMDGIYAPEAAIRAANALDGMIVSRGVVVGVPDDRAAGGYESEMAARFGWVAVSSELVAPVIVAAHMGLRVAAIVMVN